MAHPNHSPRQSSLFLIISNTCSPLYFSSFLLFSFLLFSFFFLILRTHTPSHTTNLYFTYTHLHTITHSYLPLILNSPRHTIISHLHSRTLYPLSTILTHALLMHLPLVVKLSRTWKTHVCHFFLYTERQSTTLISNTSHTEPFCPFPS